MLGRYKICSFKASEIPVLYFSEKSCCFAVGLNLWKHLFELSYAIATCFRASRRRRVSIKTYCHDRSILRNLTIFSSSLMFTPVFSIPHTVQTSEHYSHQYRAEGAWWKASRDKRVHLKGKKKWLREDTDRITRGSGNKKGRSDTHNRKPPVWWWTGNNTFEWGVTY